MAEQTKSANKKKKRRMVRWTPKERAQRGFVIFVPVPQPPSYVPVPWPGAPVLPPAAPVASGRREETNETSIAREIASFLKLLKIAVISIVAFFGGTAQSHSPTVAERVAPVVQTQSHQAQDLAL